MIAPARRAAFRILLQIETSDAHSDELLRSPEVDALSAADRHLTTMLVLGTLRWQLALDAQIRQLLARPEAKLSDEAATSLRMGAYQLLHLDRVPAHAVLNDSVELVKLGKESGAAGMVNAVLRKIQSAGKTPRATKTRSAGELAARWAHPPWMVERWARRYGMKAAEAICQWDQEPSSSAIRTETDAGFADLETEPGAFLSCARRVVRGDAGRSEAFRDGRIRIQDEASQLVAEVLAADGQSSQPALPRNQPTRMLDLCAAPGGKTAIMAERLPGAAITAVDVSRKRLDAMRRMLPPALAERMHFEVADATKMALRPEWDRILCDVPCSGTGTMARNPEIRLRVTEADLARQKERQMAILRAGLAGLRPGGRLVYSTCSMEREENEQVVEAVLRDTPGSSVVPVEGILDEMAARGVLTAEGRERLRSATEGPYLRTIPGVHPCDGFFATVLQK
ncbi:MAG TPA: transcription antitermination factor NusB [Acidobacteriaceae bacterium]|nr:transcription antitermination factor NusB [Acidobacteriaceae bacterium]